MKNIAKITTVVALMFITTVGMASEPKLNLLPSSSTKSVVLTMKASSYGVEVRLMDADAHPIYVERMSEGLFSKKLNFKDLEDGTYYLSADDNLKKYVYTIVLENNEIKILETAEDVRPFFRKTDKMIFMNYLNLDKDALSIKIYDEEGRTVFSQNVTDEMIVEKAFNFADAYPGSYILFVKSAGKTYTQAFVVN